MLILISLCEFVTLRIFHHASFGPNATAFRQRLNGPAAELRSRLWLELRGEGLYPTCRISRAKRGQAVEQSREFFFNRHEILFRDNCKSISLRLSTNSNRSILKTSARYFGANGQATCSVLCNTPMRVAL